MTRVSFGFLEGPGRITVVSLLSVLDLAREMSELVMHLQSYEWGLPRVNLCHRFNGRDPRIQAPPAAIA